MGKEVTRNGRQVLLCIGDNIIRSYPNGIEVSRSLYSRNITESSSSDRRKITKHDYDPKDVNKIKMSTTHGNMHLRQNENVDKITIISKKIPESQNGTLEVSEIHNPLVIELSNDFNGVLELTTTHGSITTDGDYKITSDSILKTTHGNIDVTMGSDGYIKNL